MVYLRTTVSTVRATTTAATRMPSLRSSAGKERAKTSDLWRPWRRCPLRERVTTGVPPEMAERLEGSRPAAGTGAAARAVASSWRRDSLPCTKTFGLLSRRPRCRGVFGFRLLAGRLGGMGIQLPLFAQGVGSNIATVSVEAQRRPFSSIVRAASTVICVA